MFGDHQQASERAEDEGRASGCDTEDLRQAVAAPKYRAYGSVAPADQPHLRAKSRLQGNTLQFGERGVRSSLEQ